MWACKFKPRTGVRAVVANSQDRLFFSQSPGQLLKVSLILLLASGWIFFFFFFPSSSLHWECSHSKVLDSFRDLIVYTCETLQFKYQGIASAPTQIALTFWFLILSSFLTLWEFLYFIISSSMHLQDFHYTSSAFKSIFFFFFLVGGFQVVYSIL